MSVFSGFLVENVAVVAVVVAAAFVVVVVIVAVVVVSVAGLLVGLLVGCRYASILTLRNKISEKENFLLSGQ